MRDLKKIYDNSVSESEKEWDAVMFVDKAIKTSVEIELEILARVLCGREKFEIIEATKEEDLFVRTHAQVDGLGGVATIVTKHKMLCKMRFVKFWGDNKAQIYTQIIDFYMSGRNPCSSAIFKLK